MATIGDVHTQIYTKKVELGSSMFSDYDINPISILNLLDKYRSINPAWQKGWSSIKRQDFIEDIKNKRRESVRRRRPIWMDDDTIHINLNETEPDQFHLIEYEGGNYLIGVTKDNKLQMYLLPKESKG